MVAVTSACRMLVCSKLKVVTAIPLPPSAEVKKEDAPKE